MFKTLSSEGEKMKKAEFIQRVAEDAGLSRKDTTAVIEASLALITKTLVNGESVSFIGFGAFSTIIRAARKTKVPQTNRVVDVPETINVKFKTGKNLKEAVAKKLDNKIKLETSPITNK